MESNQGDYENVDHLFETRPKFMSPVWCQKEDGKHQYYIEVDLGEMSEQEEVMMSDAVVMAVKNTGNAILSKRDNQ